MLSFHQFTLSTENASANYLIQIITTLIIHTQPLHFFFIYLSIHFPPHFRLDFIYSSVFLLFPKQNSFQLRNVAVYSLLVDIGRNGECLSCSYTNFCHSTLSNRLVANTADVFLVFEKASFRQNCPLFTVFLTFCISISKSLVG